MALIPVLGGGSSLTGAQIKILYEGEPDTNVFDDDAQSKLAGIDENAADDQTGAEIKAAYEAEPNTNAFDDAAKAKVASVESGATADQTNTEILNAWEIATGRDAANDGGKLDGIEALADVTDATNVNAAGAVMEADTSTATFQWVVDEDDMSSNLDTKVPTQQSVKAFVDAAVIAAGSGDVVGPGSAINENVAVFDGTTGKLIKDSSVATALLNSALQPGDNISDLTNDSAFITMAGVTFESLNANSDVGTGATQVAAGDHAHAGTYEPVDATIIRQVDIDDVAVNGVTTAPISSNWAYDHQNNTGNPHNVTAAQIGVEAGATADQTDAEILTAWESETGRTAADDGSKLDGIEALADVTDTANVTAAGALMDSEVANLADVKAFDPADYAVDDHTHTALDNLTVAGSVVVDVIAEKTDVAGVTIDGLLIKDGGIPAAAVTAHEAAIDHDGLANYSAAEHIDWTGASANFYTTGNVSLNGFLWADTLDPNLTSTVTVNGIPFTGGKVDGRNLSVDGPKLDGIEALADVTYTANVTAAGALMDSELASLSGVKTLTVPDSTTISTFGATLVDDTDQAAAQATLGVDPAGTDNSTDVTLAGALDYITLADQVLTRNPIDLTADVTGDLPIGNLPSIDDDTMATASDTTLATSESIKAYVDAQVPGGSGDAWGDALDADIVPYADGTRDLGSTANRFAEAHVDSLDLAGTTAVTGILDEDDMASNSATALATQQSIKAYGDNSAGVQRLNVLNEGVKGDGTDDSTAINSLLSSGAKHLIFP